jgi:solute carrier family 25 carnitine/acylcarnitine transporter 20/29
MASPLLGIAGVNSLLFASCVYSKRVVSPFPQLSLKEIAVAGAMAGAANAILASPGMLHHSLLQLDHSKALSSSRDV